MNIDYQIPEPIVFNPLKHHLSYIKEFIETHIDAGVTNISKELKHIGTSVMDVYTGSLSTRCICSEVSVFLKKKNITNFLQYSQWLRNTEGGFHTAELSDESQWMLKLHNNPVRYVHIFPARNSSNTFRVKANTLKSALIYNIIVGKDLVTGSDLNKVRPLLDLSPVKDPEDTEAIVQLIEILRS